MSNEELRQKLRANMTDIEIKDVMKTAITEWMDAKFQTFGKWSLTGLAVMGLGALTYFILRMNGWELTQRP